VTALEVVGLLSGIATTVGVPVAAWQLVLAKRQGVTSFEDSVVKEYRELAASLPTKALLGEPLSPEEQQAALDEFYRYFDLCNHQVFLRQQKRITNKTWIFWRDGILSNMKRPAFAAAWADISSRANGDFSELRALCPPPAKRPAASSATVGA
jgi:hypothetical protein